MSSKRLMGIRVTPELIMHLARQGEHYYRVESDIPKTAEFHSCYYAHEQRCFIVYFSDESFAEVGEGYHIPLLDAPVIHERHDPGSLIVPDVPDAQWVKALKRAARGTKLRSKRTLRKLLAEEAEHVDPGTDNSPDIANRDVSGSDSRHR